MKQKTVEITVISTMMNDKKAWVNGWGKGIGDTLIIHGYTHDINEARECFDLDDAKATISRFRNHHGREFTTETVTIPVSKRHEA